MIEGTVKNKQIIVGGVAIGTTTAKDGVYDVGIRPEDFKVSEEGIFVDTENIEHIGRDTMIRFSVEDKQLRALVGFRYCIW